MERSAEITITPNDDGSFSVMATDTRYGGRTGMAIRLADLNQLIAWLTARLAPAPASGEGG